jgi:hypothetical protein
MSDLELLADTMEEWSTTSGDHHMLAAAAIRQLAAQQNSESEPVAWMFQHEDTGMVSIIDLQQIEWGYEAANPRWKKVSALYTTPQPVVDAKPIAAVRGYYNGRCIIKPLDPALVLPVGMALYAAPPAGKGGEE